MQAGQDQKRGFATVVIASDTQTPDKVIGFYTLAAASVLLTNIPEAEARRMPRYPAVPAIRLGRLAVASAFQGQHMGSLLVLAALRRSCCNEPAQGLLTLLMFLWSWGKLDPMTITKEYYERIADCFPRQRGNVSLDNLNVLNAILYVAENGCKWRRLPKEFGN